MEFTKLSNRLDLVASFVPAGRVCWTWGSDHAYLPISLLQEGKIEVAIAISGGDPISLLTESPIMAWGQIEVRLANGLAAFEPTDGISCHHCWYGRIADILAAGLEN